MRRFRRFRTGSSRSGAADRQAALTGATAALAQGLNGDLRNGSILGDGEVVAGNTNEKVIPNVKFTKPGVPVFAVHSIGWTVYNWDTIDVKPSALIERSRKRPTRDGMWFEAIGANLDSEGKFDPPVIATIRCWGEPGQEPRRKALSQ